MALHQRKPGETVAQERKRVRSRRTVDRTFAGRRAGRLNKSRSLKPAMIRKARRQSPIVRGRTPDKLLADRRRSARASAVNKGQQGLRKRSPVASSISRAPVKTRGGRTVDRIAADRRLARRTLRLKQLGITRTK